MKEEYFDEFGIDSLINLKEASELAKEQEDTLTFTTANKEMLDDREELEAHFDCKIMSLKETLEYCSTLKGMPKFSLPSNIDEQIRDQVIEKCVSISLRCKLLEKGKTLTLETVRDMARAMRELWSRPITRQSPWKR